MSFYDNDDANSGGGGGYKDRRDENVAFKVFVGGLNPEVPQDEVSEYFGQFGSVVELDLPFDRMKNQRRAFCFVTFDSADAVTRATKQERQVIKDGVEVDVKRATPRPRGGGGRGSFGGGGRGRGSGDGYQRRGGSGGGYRSGGGYGSENGGGYSGGGGGGYSGGGRGGGGGGRWPSHGRYGGSSGGGGGGYGGGGSYGSGGGGGGGYGGRSGGGGGGRDSYGSRENYGGDSYGQSYDDGY